MLSLQATLVANFIELQASRSELKILAQKCKTAKARQDSAIDKLVKECWDSVKQDLHLNFPLTIQYDCDYYAYSSGDYDIYADDCANGLTITYGNGHCIIKMNVNGVIFGCLNCDDNCDRFDAIKNDEKAIEQLMYLLHVTHPKMWANYVALKTTWCEVE